jgi:hypothetical protein
MYGEEQTAAKNSHSSENKKKESGSDGESRTHHRLVMYGAHALISPEA